MKTFSIWLFHLIFTLSLPETYERKIKTIETLRGKRGQDCPDWLPELIAKPEKKLKTE